MDMDIDEQYTAIENNELTCFIIIFHILLSVLFADST